MRTRTIVVALVAVLGASLIGATGASAKTSPASRGAVPERSVQAPENLVAPRPNAVTSIVRCPLCVVAAITVVRAALVIRAAAAARAAYLAARQLAAATRAVIRTTRTRITRVSREARTVARRGTSYVRRNWPKLKYDTRNCLSTAAFVQSRKFLEDGALSKSEFDSYVLFGGGWLQYSPIATFEIQFPLRVDAGSLVGAAEETAFSCALGMGVAKYWRSKKGPRPK